MYVVTFYSFKGGVGRSMALVNVGVQLAKAGKRVLIVDFDLEAPGIPTFGLDKPENESLGVVDFISTYLETDTAPDISDYVYKSTQFSEGGIWVMPVGQQDEAYSSRINNINWKTLYAERQGFLFFEDMRRQWEVTLSPDYVLIDSRTGHSDVEGLCTRQLPDAVCLLFFPNEQNLQGLSRIVSNIRHENERDNPGRRQVDMHFVVSNVPDLDDEEQILGRTMNRFQEELRYTALAAEIHHYNSLSLLNQEIFSLTRPNSRLTNEYRQITQAITRRNLADRNTVIELLKSTRANIGEVATSGPERLLDQLEMILKNFSQDGEVLYRVAVVYAQLGNAADALSLLLADAVTTNFGTAGMYATRARLRRRAGSEIEAKEDLARMLNAGNADFESFVLALTDISQLDASLYNQLPESVAFRSLPLKDRVFLAFQFEGGQAQVDAKVRVLEEMIATVPPDLGVDIDDLKHEISLALISQGRPLKAIEYLQPRGEASTLPISDAFNLAMALWARDGRPPIEMFERVAGLDSARRGVGVDSANYAECLAIVHGVLNNVEVALRFLNESRRRILARPKREFSAWTYTKVTPKEFASHLDEIRQLVDGEKVHPRFVSQNRSLFDNDTLH